MSSVTVHCMANHMASPKMILNCKINLQANCLCEYRVFITLYSGASQIAQKAEEMCSHTCAVCTRKAHLYVYVYIADLHPMHRLVHPENCMY